jgi:hypothetical protein
MRRLLVVPALALVVLSPTAVQADPGDLVVCNEPPPGTIVLTPNDTNTPTVESPPYDPEVYNFSDVRFQLDLYPATATDTATVSSTLNWDLDINDWDLFLFDPDEADPLATSDEVQFGPLEAPPTESLSIELVHCSLFMVSVGNYQAVPLDDVDPLRLSVTAGGVETTSTWAVDQP